MSKKSISKHVITKRKKRKKEEEEDKQKNQKQKIKENKKKGLKVIPQRKTLQA